MVSSREYKLNRHSPLRLSSEFKFKINFDIFKTCKFFLKSIGRLIIPRFLSVLPSTLFKAGC